MALLRYSLFQSLCVYGRPSGRIRISGTCTPSVLPALSFSLVVNHERSHCDDKESCANSNNISKTIRDQEQFLSLFNVVPKGMVMIRISGSSIGMCWLGGHLIFQQSDLESQVFFKESVANLFFRIKGKS